ncbi:Neuropilin-2 Vascular endothelial cell growth factor 165 receptor 2 [Collichthys lucidus]|uniref:Neuropilin-2 Vascular endothelial cell growth factor 165 receptor 2 n=1 Tax=Collichthys lucidus TaxID=240159 RepID=A0A4U5U0F9_COLLU|nr:Neuropilin-2 Vascular endothelial cell growth factor 165 receptor 2 [Collichthys lucidus]
MVGQSLPQFDHGKVLEAGVSQGLFDHLTSGSDGFDTFPISKIPVGRGGFSFSEDEGSDGGERDRVCPGKPLREPRFAAEPCGGYLDASDAGYITTPGYPLEYPPHQNCRWVITAPEPSQRIVLNFNPHFEIEKLDCRYDYVEIHDGNSESADLLGKHCSNIAPAPIISSGPSLHIKFVSDYAHQGAGFSLRYEIFKTGSDCSRNFTSPTGLIESPGFPDKYPHNLECSFIIIVPPSMDVTLTFLTFDLENDPLPGGEGDCKYDWLEVWDGLPGVGPLIGRYCGTRVPPEIQSSTGILSLSFHTDMAVAKDGFSARYNMTHKEVSETFHCSNAFGMESGKITDDQITASSSFYDEHWLPRQARLNYNDNGWTPNEDSNREYIQVDLHTLKVLTGIATQGAISKETQKAYHVTTFKLEVSTNGEDWMVYRHGKNHKAELSVAITTLDLGQDQKPPIPTLICGREDGWRERYGGRRQTTTVPDTVTPTLPREEQTTAAMRPATTPSLSAVCDFEQSLCGWSADPQSGVSWSLHTASSSSTGHGTHGTRQDLALGSDNFSGNYLHLDAGAHTQRKRARLLSPEVGPEQGPLCLVFYYQLQGEALGSLRVLLRDSDQEETLLWALKGDQGSHWREGRTILPQSPKEYQVVFEGFFDHPTRGHIRIDNIHMSSSIELEQCTQPIPALTPGITRGAMSGMEPTVDTVAVQPVPAYWYYVLAGGGALLLLVTVTVVVILCCHRYHWATKKTSHHHSVMYHNSQHPSQQGHQNCYQNQNLNYNLIHSPNQNHLYPDPRPMDFGKDPVFNPKQPIDGDYVFPGWPSSFSTPSSDVVPPSITVVSEKDKDNAWLYTLDPILLTIIVMSSLGVLLGAVCAGLLLYCTCSYSGLSSRSSTTLENYNFELYDGIKHKVKINQQRCCSEA